MSASSPEPPPASRRVPPGRRVAGLALLVSRRATANFIDAGASQIAAGISYFALISLFPLALLAFSALGLVLRDASLKRRVIDGIVESVPVQAPAVEQSLAALVSGGATIGLVALLATAWTGSALAAALRKALNTMFAVERPRPLVQGKLLDVTVAPVLGFLLLLSLALTTAWRFAQAEAVAIGILRAQPLVWELGAAGIAGAISFLAFLFLYWLLPNARLRLRDLWPGALLAAAAFELVKLGFAVYLANFGNYDVIYGSLGGVITLLVWVYVSANIMLFGAAVAAEIPRSVRGEDRHTGDRERDVGWRGAALLLLRGLFLGPDESPPQTRRR